MLAAYTIASKTAGVCRCRREGMLTPGLADLLEAVVVSGAAAHSVNILRNKGMVGVRQGKPIDVFRPFVAGVGSQRNPHPAVYCATVQLHQADQFTDDYVRAGDSSWQRNVKRGQRRGFHTTIRIERFR